MPKTQDENRAAWAEHVAYLKTLPCENIDHDTISEVERAIQRCPYDSITDAILQINGGWLCGLKYDMCLAFLLQAGCLEPSGFGVFRIDRRKLPRIEVSHPLVEAMERAMRPAEPKEQQYVPTQFDLFGNAEVEA
jgi:hypothetical protein